MSGGIGPLEPGEDTLAHDRLPRTDTATPLGSTATRRRALAALATAALLAGGLHDCASRPEDRPPTPPPYPAQSVTVIYAGTLPPLSSPAIPSTFTFQLMVAMGKGPEISVEKVAQPSESMALSTAPILPLTLRAHSHRTLTITIRIRDCAKTPRNASLPYLDVTLRNIRAIQQRSYILGPGYAEDLATWIAASCPDPTRPALPPPADSHNAR
ncbi:Tat pathway signal sequence domain protein [Streptomyces sp. NPDC060194]|uniref:Tat pathway signal sequence domain protein n=1 Tax=Streptomyces sp. NPDC060194 TaxID=3347069 RepID=UPI003663B813